MLNKLVRICNGLVFCITTSYLVTSPAMAGVIYDNGPLNGDTNGFAIDIGSGYAVTDSFTLLNGSTLTGVNLGVWVTSGETPTTLDWVITGSSFSGTMYGSGSNSILSYNFVTTNDFGFDVFDASFALPDVALANGTYWLQLQNATTSIAGDPMYWDENDGPSQAYTSLGGDPNSAQSLVNYSGDCPSCSGSETFQILSPEPGTITMMAFGFMLLSGPVFMNLRRKVAWQRVHARLASLK